MRTHLHMSVTAMLCAIGGLALAPSDARASFIMLSIASTDSTPAAALDASLEFIVSDLTLTLTVANATASPQAYRMGRIYFNAPATLTSLTLETPSSGWTLEEAARAGGFGLFDYALIGGVGSDPDQIRAGESQTFTLAFTGAASELDFVAEYSRTPSGNNQMIVAAKFTGGPGDDSAFGGTLTVPAPATALLLLGQFTLARRRRA